MKYDTDVNSNIIQYADDSFIFCSGKTIESKLLHEKSIAVLILFFKKNELSVDESKTEIHYFWSL